MKRLAIIVPYRDRASHLALFLPHIRKTMKDQNIDYKIILVEQDHTRAFNRAKLLNVGYAYTNVPLPQRLTWIDNNDHTKGHKVDSSQDIGVFDYYCFHDIDMLPLEADYSYVTKPTHLAGQAEQFGFRMPYPTYFGGVTLFDKESFKKVNGYCNEYWGWGAEDDDMYRRCIQAGITPDFKPGRFTSLSHERVIDEKLYHANVSRLNAFGDSSNEGLNSLVFEVWNAYGAQEDMIGIQVKI